MENIKVIDDTFLDIASSFSKTSTDLDKTLESMAAQIKKAATEGFSEGNISNNLESLAKYIEELKGELETIGSDMETFMQNYLRDLDDADEYIY